MTALLGWHGALPPELEKEKKKKKGGAGTDNQAFFHGTYHTTYHSLTGAGRQVIRAPNSCIHTYVHTSLNPIMIILCISLCFVTILNHVYPSRPKRNHLSYITLTPISIVLYFPLAGNDVKADGPKMRE